MYKIGIVGAGAMGEYHKNAIDKNEGAVFTAVCDLVIERAEALVRGASAKAYSDYKEMQENESLDAVIINLPHYLHKAATVYFLDQKVAVLVEKPMAITTEECDAMIEASKRNNTPLAVGHVQKYMECYRRLREIIKSGKLGRLCHMTEVRNCDYFPGRPGWFLDKKLAGAGILMNYGAHTLDKFFYTTGCRVESVEATGNNFLTGDSVEASAQMYLKMTDGVGAACTYCGCHVKERYETFFYFTNGEAKIEDGTYLYISEAGRPYRKIELDYEKDYFAAQTAEFIKLLNGEKSEIVTPEYGREVISVLEKAISRF